MMVFELYSMFMKMRIEISFVKFYDDLKISF